MSGHNDGGTAFPIVWNPNADEAHSGMSVLDYFAAQALANASICTGKAGDYELQAWFGGYSGGITNQEIAAAQAYAYAGAMLRRRAVHAKGGPV